MKLQISLHCLFVLLMAEVIVIHTYSSPSDLKEKGDISYVRIKRDQQKVDEKDKNFVNNNNNNNNPSAMKNPTLSSTIPPASNNNSTSSVPKVKTLFIPDRSPINVTVHTTEDASDDDEGSNVRASPGQNNFDEKAIERGLIVIGGIAVIIVVYLGIKIALIKRRKVVKRYGRIEASEMDLLDEIEDDDESEEEELFDITQHHQRRS